MSATKQYRAKAAEFKALRTSASASRSPKETNELRDLEQTYTTLAENEEWMAGHIDNAMQRGKNFDERTSQAAQKGQILQCLGAAVLMRWNTVPRKLQNELFECASSIADLQQPEPLREQIARVIHERNDGAEQPD